MTRLLVSMVFIIVLALPATGYSQTESQRSGNVSVLDIDASGEVDALTDGLLILRSLFGLSDDALSSGVVSPECVDCDSEIIENYLLKIKEKPQHL